MHCQVNSLQAGLCNGRLFSCAGHGVSPDLPQHVLGLDSTYMFTMVRHPWDRLLSTFHYLKANPHSAMLAPDINTSVLLSLAPTIQAFVAYPGINNCMTKMLNGLRCGESIEINEQHLDVAKRVLTALQGFGITGYFKTSICLFYWMYGGDVNSQFFQKWRQGHYDKGSAMDILGQETYNVFLHREKFDLELYSYAHSLFLSRLSTTGCPIIDHIEVI